MPVIALDVGQKTINHPCPLGQGFWERYPLLHRKQRGIEPGEVRI
jgi:hypothetical protein